MSLAVNKDVVIREYPASSNGWFSLSTQSGLGDYNAAEHCSLAPPCDSRTTEDGRNRYVDCHSFDLVFVFPMPDLATDEEDAYFKSKYLTAERPTYADIIHHIVVPPDLRRSLSIGHCQSLKHARWCVIELIQSFLDSLSASLKGGVQVFTFLSECGEQLFLCVKISDEMADMIAEMDEYPVQLSANCLDSLHIRISNTADLVPAYVTFDTEMKQRSLYKVFNHPQFHGETSVLRNVDHLRVLYAKVTDYIDIHEMKRLGLLLCIFSDHNKRELLRIRGRWASLRLLFYPSQPIEEVRDYFGENLAFYFLFLNFMIRGVLALVAPATACMIARGMGYKEEARMLSTLISVIWSTVMVRLWARQASYYCNKWGTDRFEHASGVLKPLNPDFHGEKKPSRLDENILTLQPSFYKRSLGFAVSCLVSFLFTCLILCGVAGNRFWAYTLGAKSWKRTALALSVQIQIGEKIWDFLVVEALNRLEQHTTLYSYDQSRVAKSFVIKFVNACIAFLYIAYIQPLIDPEGCGEDCTEYLLYQLVFVFATYISFGLIDSAIPYVSMRISKWWEDREARIKGYKTFNISFLEQQWLMFEYTGADEQDAYLCILIPLAYVLMFGSMAPDLVHLAYLSFIFQLRAHAWKFTSVLRRPFPVAATGIGTWEVILPWLVSVSNCNCIGMMIVASSRVGWLFPGFTYLTEALDITNESRAARLILFFILQFVVLAWHYLLKFAIPSRTAQTQLEMDRQNLQRDRLVQKSQSTLHENIVLACTGGKSASCLQSVQPLREGHEFYVSPIVRA